MVQNSQDQGASITVDIAAASDNMMTMYEDETKRKRILNAIYKQR